ncbi:MAG: YD repeat-containing protein [Myxococcota bacterium]|jgi:YD repeat-containing protein
MTAPRPLVWALLAALAAPPAHASDAGFLGLSISGDGVTPSAADALSHEPPVKPIALGATASGQGDAQYGIPLELPPTRLPPSIGLSYSSAAGAHGWLGRGWSLSEGMTLTRITGQVRAQAYDEEPVAPYRLSGGGVSGILFWRDGWELHSTSPTSAVVTEHPDGTWSVKHQGVTTTLEPAPPLEAPDTWRTRAVQDAWGNQVVYEREGDQLHSVSWGGTVGGSPGEWAAPALYTLDVVYEAAPTVSYRAAPGGITVVDQRIVGFTLDVSGACADEELACDGMAIPAWDLCYGPLPGGGGEEVLTSVYLRNDSHPRGGVCTDGETDAARVLAELEYTEWEALSPHPAPGPGPFGGSSTNPAEDDARSTFNRTVTALADVNGDGWVDRLSSGGGSAQVQAYLRDGGPEWASADEARAVALPWGPVGWTELDESVSVITGWSVTADPWNPYHASRTRLAMQRWVDLDRDGFRDLIVAREAPDGISLITDESTFAANLGRDPTTAGPLYTWDVHYGRAWGLEEAVPLSAPFRFPDIAHSPSHPRRYIVDGDALERTYDNVDTQLVDLHDLTGDGWVDLVYVEGGSVYLYPFLPELDGWADTPDVIDLPAAYRLDGASLDALQVVRHHTTIVDLDDPSDALRTYQQPRILHAEVIRRFTDLNGDGHVDLVDAAPWEGDGTWRVVLGHPGGFAADAIDWPAPVGFLTRTYEGEPAVDTCQGPPIVVEFGWPRFDGPVLDFGGGLEDEVGVADGVGDADTDVDTDTDAYDILDDGPPFGVELYGSYYDAGDAPMWEGLEARVASCGFGTSPDPQRVLVDLIDLDGDGRLDVVDADAGWWYRNLGDGFDVVGVPIPWADFPTELARSQAFTTVTFAPRAEDPMAIEALSPSHGDNEVLLRVQDVNADGLPDVVTPDEVRLAPYHPPGLLDTIRWSTGAITTVDYDTTASGGGVSDPEPFTAHRAIVQALTLADPATDQHARTEVDYLGPHQFEGQFQGFHEVVHTQSIADARTRWTMGAGAFQEFSTTRTVFALERDFTVPGQQTYQVDQALPWMPVDGALPTSSMGGSTDLQTVSTVVSVYEDWARGKRLDRTEVESLGDGGAGGVWMTIDAVWDPETDHLAEVRRYPGLGAWSEGPESTRVQFEDVVTSAGGSLRLHGTQRTFGWDTELGAEVQQEWVEFVYDDGTDSPTHGAAPVTPAVMRQSACGGVPGDDVCADAWETWSFERGPRGEVEAMSGPGGASAASGWALGGSVVVGATDAMGNSTTMVVDGLGRAARTTDPNGVRTEVTLDALGRQAALTLQGVGQEPRTISEWHHHHDTFPEWVEEVRYTADSPGDEALPRSFFVVSDGLGRPVQQWSPELGPTGWTVLEVLTDLSGNVAVEREPRGEALFEAAPPSLSTPGPWDTLTYTDALGVARLAWSAHTGNIRTSRPTATSALTADGGDRQTLLHTDQLGRLTTVYEGDPTAWTRTGSYAWDGRSRLTQFTDANGNAYRSLYDQVGRLLEVDRRPLAPDADWEPWVAMTYDGPYPSAMFDADGSLTVSWEHDALGRATERFVLRNGVMDHTVTRWDTNWVGVKASEVTSRVDEVLTTLTFEIDAGARWGLGHITGQTHTWFDGHAVSWAFERDSDGAPTRTTLPEGYTVTTDRLPNRWHRADTVDTGADSVTVLYAPGDFGHAHGGWSVDRAEWNCPLSVDLGFADPVRVDRVDVGRTDCSTNQLQLGWDAGGRLTSRDYTGAGLPAGLFEYGYDDLGRVLDVFHGAELVERIERDRLGVPTALTREMHPGLIDPALPTPVPTTWTYAPAERFGEVAGRDGASVDAPWIEEVLAWDPMGRLERVSHREPTERAHERYSYDGLGRLARLDGYERTVDPETGDVDILTWAQTHLYGTDDQLVYEARTALEPKVVHRFDGYLSDTRTGVTVSALPMVRIVDGEFRFSVQEPSGHAPWVFDGDGAELNHSVVGATGVDLYQAGAGWHLDGMHGAEPDAVVGLTHHGIRHARLDDGLWLQPEPLLALGLANSNLARPLGYGPAYAMGDTQTWSDRTGFGLYDGIMAWLDSVRAHATDPTNKGHQADHTGSKAGGEAVATQVVEESPFGILESDSLQAGAALDDEDYLTFFKIMATAATIGAIAERAGLPGGRASKAAARGAPELGGFAKGVAPDEIAKINRGFGGSVELGGSVDAVLASASFHDGFFKKAAVVVRGIAHGHLFDNGNKRTANAVLNLLRSRNGVTTGASASETRQVINQVATGELSDIDEIATALRGF